MQKIEQMVQAVTDPLRFLEWYTRKWENREPIPRSFEGCVELCLRERGAEKVALNVDTSFSGDGFISIRAGVQETTVEQPYWVGLFIDSIAGKMTTASNIEGRSIVVLALVTAIIRMAMHYDGGHH